MTIKTNERIIVETMNSGAWDEARVANLENLINEYEVFYSVASGTSGAVPIYTGATLVLAQYGGLNGLVVNLDSNGKPTDSLAKTSGGASITVVIDGAGNYTLSGASAVYPVAIVYQLAITQKLAGNIPLSNVVDYTVVHGTLSYQDANNVSITGGSITGIVDLDIADGGTGASTAAGARANLGVTATGADTTYAFRANNLSDLANAATARTNLGLGTAATSNTGDFTPASHVGSGGTQHANATTSVAGFMSSADKTKLDGVAPGATANQTDAFLLSRANHTGTQPLNTISDAGTMASQNANNVVITGGSAVNLTEFGVGTDPTYAWGAGWSGIGVGPTGTLSNSGTTTPVTVLSNNAYFDGTNWRYIASGPASQWQCSTNQHIIRQAISGTAGAVITWTEAGRFSPSGNFLAGKSIDDTFARIQSSNGITLGNTANANPTVLDWYEEGTFTPVIGATSGTITSSSSANCQYTRNGREVTLTGSITITNNGTGAGGLTIGGLPFAAANVSAGGGIARESAIDGRTSSITQVGSSTVFVMYRYDNTYPAANGSVFNFEINYIA